MKSGIKGKTSTIGGTRSFLPTRGKLPLAAALMAFITLACTRPPEAVYPSGDAGETTASTPSSASMAGPKPTPPIATEDPEIDVESWFAERVEDTSKHAAILASLYPGRTMARLNPDTPLNPASLVKLATSLAALKKLSAAHRFEVGVYADGQLQENGTFNGDLYFSGGTPSFDQASAEMIRDELRRLGIEKITGTVYVSPGFGYRYSDTPEHSAGLLSTHLFPNRPPATAIAVKPSGVEIFVLRSQPLDRVLLFQNTFSSNIVAQRVGDAIGGPGGLRRFLIEELGLSPGAVALESTSGLGENAMTARDIFAVLRELDKELARQGLKPHDILPVAGVGRSTLNRRLSDPAFAHAVAGKTGTLSAADGGVGMASLAGYIDTSKGERLAFVLMDEGPSFRLHAEMQEQFLLDVLAGRVVPKPLDIERPPDILSRQDLEIEFRADVPRTRRQSR